MKRCFLSLSGLICFSAICVFAAAQGTQPQARNKSAQNPANTSAASEGEKRFRINCGRCHNAPEDISPRETPAVVRHMRVRAMLSAEDEKFILEYLAP